MSAARPVLLLLLALLAWGLDVPPGARESRVEGFRVLSQCPPDVTARLAAELVRVRGALAAWIGGNLKPLPPGLPPLPVLLFADRERFMAYAREHARNVATAHAEGYYSGDGTPGGGSLCLFHDGGRELSTARHELVHYLLDQLLPAKAGQPVWFNEGLAVVAEDAWIDPGEVRPSTIPRQRGETLRRLATGGGASLDAITGLAADGWLAAAGADRAAADDQYSASYGAVLYLLNADPARYWGFLKRMAAGEDHGKAYRAAFAGIPGGLDAAWRTWAGEGAWQAARAADPSASAAAACEHGLAWLPEHGKPGDPVRAARWLSAAARGFAATPGYELDAAAAWLAAARGLDGRDPATAGAAAEAAAALYAARGHTAGRLDAELAACRGWGDEAAGGDWDKAAAAGARAIALAEALGPDELRAAANSAYGACFLAGRATAVPAGSDRRSEARRSLGRARDLHHAAKRPDSEAASILLLAQALAPDDGQAGDWAGCLALAAEAEALWRALPDADAHQSDVARALGVQAGMLRPDRNPGGDWGRAAAAYDAEAMLLPASETPSRLRNQLDRASCRLNAGNRALAARLFAAAEAMAAGDPGLAAYAAYQCGWALQQDDAQAAAAAFRRSMPLYRAAGKLREEAMAAGQAAQALQQAQAPGADIAAAYAAAAALEAARGDAARTGYSLYQQAWFSEPARQPGSEPAAAAELYAAAAQAWKPAEPARAAQALGQRARLLTPEAKARSGWEAGARAWGELAALQAVLPDAAKRQAERGHALHQQAWCLIRGDGKRMTDAARGLFTEAVRLQRAGGDEAGAKASQSWLK